MKKYLALAFVAIYIIGLVYVVGRFWDPNLISGVGWKFIAGLTLLYMLAISLFGEVSRAICVALGHQLSRSEAIGLVSANSLLNYLPFRPGAGFQGAYLISVVGLPLSKFLLFGAFLFLMNLICNGFLGLIAAIAEWRMYSPANIALAMLAAIYALITLTGIGTMFGGGLIRHLWLPFKLRRFTEAISDNLHLLIGNKLLLIRISGIMMAVLMLNTLRIYLEAELFEIPVTISGAFLLSTASIISRLVSIFPAGLGIVEAAMSATYSVLGGSLESGILLSAFDRIINLAASIIMGGSWLLISRKQVGQLLSKKKKEDK